MKNIKIYTLFSTFTPKEWNKFLQYVYLNYGKQLLLCKTLQLLEKKYPSFNTNKTDILRHLFPKEEPSKQRLNDVFYRLTKITEYYIGNIKVKSQRNINLNILDYYKDNKIKQLYDTKIKRLQSKNLSPNAEDFLLDFLYEQNKMQQIELLGNRNKDPNLQAVHDSLDKKYLYEKLKMTCISNNYTNINNYQYNHGLLPFFFDKLKDIIKKEDGIIFLFFHACLFQTNDTEEDFKLVFEYLKHESITHSEDMAMVFGMCINFCIRRINQRHIEYFSILFSIYRRQVETACIYNEEGFISPYAMKNILTTAIRMNEFEWVEKFVLGHHDKLPPQNREENYNYFLARIYYEKKQYKKCVQLLLQTEAIDFLNNLSIRVLQSKACYALDDYEGLDNVLHSLRLYLLRHKNKGYHYTFHVNFIKALKKIISMPSHSKKANEEVLSYINKLGKVAEMSWLQGILT